MAVRALIPADRLNICHVNSNDGSAEYEAGIAYKAGTVVTYQGNTYVACVDIEDSDSDTPDEAPDKWGLSPDAFGSAGNGEMGDLENRVSTLETKVGEIEDVIDAIPDGYELIGMSQLEITIDEISTFSACLDKLTQELLTYVQSLEDDEIIQPELVDINGIVAMETRPVIFSNQSANTNIVCSTFYTNAGGFLFFSAITADNNSMFVTLGVNGSTLVWSYNDQGASPTSAGQVIKCYFKKYKKIIHST